MTALEDAAMKWLPPSLPTLHATIGRSPMFKKDELAARPQDTANASNSFHYRRNGA
jgi:hypothetical protein